MTDKINLEEIEQRLVSSYFDVDAAATFMDSARTDVRTLVDEVRRLQEREATLEPQLRAQHADELEAAAAAHHEHACRIAGVSTDRNYGGTASGMRFAARVLRTGKDDTAWDPCPAGRRPLGARTDGMTNAEAFPLQDAGVMSDPPTPRGLKSLGLQPLDGDELTHLSFAELQRISVLRCLRWHGPDSEPRSGADWSNAMCGEAGEAANVVKKLRRLETGTGAQKQPAAIELQQMLGAELADTICYAVLVAAHYGIDLGAAVIDKFNAVSEREGFPERLVVDSEAVDHV